MFWLLLALGALTVPVAWATSLPAFAVLLLVGGALVAPSITATVDTLSRVVPSTAMGEAMGWHGTAFTVGIAAGAPVGGFVIDHFGWAAGFAVTGSVGVAVGTLGPMGGPLMDCVGALGTVLGAISALGVHESGRLGSVGPLRPAGPGRGGSGRWVL